MTNEEAIKILKGAIKKPNTKDGYLGQAIDLAIKALDQISHLKDRPCEACEFYTGEAWGCSKWECVFEGSDKE